MPRLVPILEKDSVRRFLRLINREGRGMGWGFIITPQTFNQMILQNALRCAKVVLEGKDPELHGFRANPNCMNRFVFSPSTKLLKFSLLTWSSCCSNTMHQQMYAHQALKLLRTYCLYMLLWRTLACTCIWRIMHFLTKMIWIAIMQISSMSASLSIFCACLRWYATSIYFLNTTKENVDFLSQTTTLAILGLNILTSEFSNT